MKKTVLLLAILFISLNSHATHQSVLELFYDHIPGTSKYVFTLLEQVEAQTIMYTADINSNSPAGTFVSNRVLSIPISGSCSSLAWINIYQSDTIDLGPIPVVGYKFGFTSCCRTPALTNIQNPSSRSYYVEAYMFPEPRQTFASSSPRFVNPAVTQRLSSFILNQPALDPDGDSVFYALTDVRQGNFIGQTAIPYLNGYSGTAPLGLNTPITINQSTGTFSATNVTEGHYVFNVEIRSYKNVSLTSIIHRDIIVTYVIPSPFAPTISLSNYSGTGPLNVNSNGVYQVTVKTEDSISFDIEGSVFLDSIFLAGTSRLFGVNNNTLGNCLGNCADFTANPNLFGTGNATGKFRFLADSTHLLGNDTAKYQVVFLAASQNNCKPYVFDNLLVDVTVVKNLSIGIAENQGLQFKVYPNPTTGILQVQSPFAQKKEVRLLNAIGQEFLRFILQEGENQINLSGIAKGLYFLVDEDGGSQRIVIQ